MVQCESVWPSAVGAAAFRVPVDYIWLHHRSSPLARACVRPCTGAPVAGGGRLSHWPRRAEGAGDSIQVYARTYSTPHTPHTPHSKTNQSARHRFERNRSSDAAFGHKSLRDKSCAHARARSPADRDPMRRSNPRPGCEDCCKADRFDAGKRGGQKKTGRLFALRRSLPKTKTYSHLCVRNGPSPGERASFPSGVQTSAFNRRVCTCVHWCPCPSAAPFTGGGALYTPVYQC